MSTNQKKISNNESCPNKVIPQGVSLIFNFTKLNADFSFSYARGIRPLQPMNAIKVVNNTIEVSVVVFIDASINIESSNSQVIQDLSYTNDGQPYLNLYICYDTKPRTCKDFAGYKFDFTVNFNESTFTPNPAYPKKIVPTINEIIHLTSFLWDEDPEASRGTEIEVEKGH
jgi:hypothetical protein